MSEPFEVILMGADSAFPVMGAAFGVLKPVNIHFKANAQATITKEAALQQKLNGV